MNNLSVLLVLDEVPYPMTNGGRIDSYFQAKYLRAVGCRVFLLFAYSFQKEFDEFLKIAPDICDDFFAFPRQKKNIRDIFSSTPYILKNRKPSSKIIEAIALKFSGIQFDLLIENHLNAHVLASDVRRCLYRDAAYLHRMHNIETTLLTSTFQASKMFSLRKWFFALEVLKMWFYERRVYEQFEHIAAISSYEQDFLAKKFPGKNIFWLPPFFDFAPRRELTSAETDEYNALLAMTKGRPVALLTGNFSGGMTVDQVQWFINIVLPLARKLVPDLLAVVAGRDAAIYFESGESVLVVNNYGSVKPLMKLCGVFVVATTGRGGVKLKLMEALGYGKSIVSTVSGVFGSGLGTTVPNSDDPQVFAQLCARAFSAPDSNKVTQAFFESRYNCESNAREMLDRVLGAAR